MLASHYNWLILFTLLQQWIAQLANRQCTVFINLYTLPTTKWLWECDINSVNIQKDFDCEATFYFDQEPIVDPDLDSSQMPNSEPTLCLHFFLVQHTFFLVRLQLTSSTYRRQWLYNLLLFLSCYGCEGRIYTNKKNYILDPRLKKYKKKWIACYRLPVKKHF